MSTTTTINNELDQIRSECRSCVFARPAPGGGHHLACGNPVIAFAIDPLWRSDYSVDHGWFIYPFNFDPIWKLKLCPHFSPDETSPFTNSHCSKDPVVLRAQFEQRFKSAQAASGIKLNRPLEGVLDALTPLFELVAEGILLVVDPNVDENVPVTWLMTPKSVDHLERVKKVGEQVTKALTS